MLNISDTTEISIGLVCSVMNVWFECKI